MLRTFITYNEEFYLENLLYRVILNSGSFTKCYTIIL